MKIGYTFLGILSALPLAWIIASWADVVTHNLTDCAYAWWNLFSILF